MAGKINGQMGMTKAMKKAARLSTMSTNRKRDKASQRAAYHREFNNAKGPSPMDPTIGGILKARVVPKEEPSGPRTLAEVRAHFK